MGRYGGEEFVAILPVADASSAYRIAESMRRAVQELDIEHPLSPFGGVTLSIGVATLQIAPCAMRGAL